MFTPNAPVNTSSSTNNGRPQDKDRSGGFINLPIRKADGSLGKKVATVRLYDDDVDHQAALDALRKGADPMAVLGLLCGVSFNNYDPSAKKEAVVNADAFAALIPKS